LKQKKQEPINYKTTRHE